jgi:hypothetical protein
MTAIIAVVVLVSSHLELAWRKRQEEDKETT